MLSQNQIDRNRVDKDKYFKNNHHSPIPHSLQSTFSGLDYYPFDEEYQFEVELVEAEDQEVIEMETNDGKEQQYRRLGHLPFEVDGESAKVYVYESVQRPGHYFVPFRDETSGNETYGAGRYLDIERQNDGTFELDFNRAYNPFCAYSDAYSCPLPPMENWLDIAIKAGEKDFPLK